MDSFARMANITWKPSDTVDLSPGYEFLGVTFDHHTDRVSLGTKIGRKIKNTNLDSLTASELESLGGRLLPLDNTTVCGAFRKKMCVRSHSLNRCLILVLKCSYSLAWVSTKLNPADIPSREEVSHGTRAKVELALGSFFNSRGGGGAGVLSNRNGPVQPLRRSNLHSVDSSK